MFNLPISGDDLELVKKVFFLAMMNGYVGKPKKNTIVELPSSKSIPFEYEEGGHKFFVQDTYFVTPYSDFSSGITVIYCDGFPVWSMTYGGKYQKMAIPFLKDALKVCYSQGKFIGGRGPALYKPSGIEVNPFNLVYYNTVETKDFRSFNGDEIVYDGDDCVAGWHRYQGNLMVP